VTYYLEIKTRKELMEKNIYQTGKKPLARDNKNKLASYQTLNRCLFSLFGTSVCFLEISMYWKRIPRFWYSRLIPRRGFRIVSGMWILDSDRYPDSGFLELYSGYQSPGFQIPQAKISRIPSHGATQIEYFAEWAQVLEWTVLVLVLCFVFPKQSMWYSQENLPVAFSY